MRMSFGIF
jgi:hypothetical protein